MVDFMGREEERKEGIRCMEWSGGEVRWGGVGVWGDLGGGGGGVGAGRGCGERGERVMEGDGPGYVVLHTYTCCLRGWCLESMARRLQYGAGSFATCKQG